tara:strand:- start:243 stop:1106 length:864 start_codon:yes stop_codon:yes gene_type:complete
MTTTISIKPMGGLGNQLFQIFATISYGLEYTCNIILPYTDQLHTGTVRNTYWDTFLIGCRNMTTYNLLNNETNESLMSVPIYNEKSFEYTKIPNPKGPKMQLHGYYQSYKYFDKHWESIKKMISLDDQQKAIKKDYADLFSTKETISLHFRIGDYANIQNCHPIMPFQYYYNAICNLTMHKNKKYRILYFCQDIDNEKVSVIINRLSRMFTELEFVKVSDDIVDWKQMLIMSVCSHNIIANSTYSWWGAYLNQNDKKMVYYPNKWFGKSLQHNTSDMFPPNWVNVYW